MLVAEKEKNNENLHAGHRERLRVKFFEGGLVSLADHEIVELLLFGAIPRQNVNEIAHALLNRFGGTLSSLFRASPQELQEVKGVGAQAALIIRLVSEIQSHIHHMEDGETPLDNPQLWFSCLKQHFTGAVFCEKVYMLTLSQKYKYISVTEVCSGTAKKASIDIRKLMLKVLQSDAGYVVLAHNHLDGNVLPSRQDLATTSYLKQLMQSVGVTLLDHLVVGGDKYTSILYGSPVFNV